MSNNMLDVLCVGRACCVFVLLVLLFRWACAVPFGVVCVGCVCCWLCCFVGRAAFRGVPFGVVCVGRVFVVGRVVSLGVQRSVWRGVCGAWAVEIAMNLVDRKTRLWIARA